MRDHSWLISLLALIGRCVRAAAQWCANRGKNGAAPWLCLWHPPSSQMAACNLYTAVMDSRGRKTDHHNLLVLPEILLHGRMLLKWEYVAGWLSLEWNNTLWICPPENTLEADTLSFCLQDPQRPSCSLIGYCRVQLGFMGRPCWLSVQTEGSTRVDS